MTEHKRIKIYQIILLLIIGIFAGCKSNEKDLDIELTQVTDLQGVFEIGIPETWHRELYAQKSQSMIVASDTTKSIQETLVITASWDTVTVFVNQHLEKLLDSLNTSVGLKTLMSRRGSMKEYRTQFSLSHGLDTLNNLNMYQYMYIIKADHRNGHLSLTARTYADTLQENQSILIGKIVESIKITKPNMQYIQ